MLLLSVLVRGQLPNLGLSIWQGITNAGKLDSIRVLCARWRHCMHPSAFRTFAHKGLHDKRLSASPALCLYATARQWSNGYSSAVSVIDKFDKIFPLRERTSACRSACSAITHLSKPPVNKKMTVWPHARQSTKYTFFFTENQTPFIYRRIGGGSVLTAYRINCPLKPLYGLSLSQNLNNLKNPGGDSAPGQGHPYRLGNLL